jgi:hypothetical protein
MLTQYHQKLEQERPAADESVDGVVFDICPGLLVDWLRLVAIPTNCSFFTKLDTTTSASCLQLVLLARPDCVDLLRQPV